ncbi:hypothetical protein J1N35_006613 [Gossypium stocksii]|uniref:Uncharacterized protein n=1 Tax=Gossypium stocksii TaxID=47602 RepID=A0A9D4AK37_9ROSI|nr:hypothetical protein J1N35_006613 [Gossypium stocksii]
MEYTSAIVAAATTNEEQIPSSGIRNHSEGNSTRTSDNSTAFPFETNFITQMVANQNIESYEWIQYYCRCSLNTPSSDLVWCTIHQNLDKGKNYNHLSKENGHISTQVFTLQLPYSI